MQGWKGKVKGSKTSTAFHNGQQNSLINYSISGLPEFSITNIDLEAVGKAYLTQSSYICLYCRSNLSLIPRTIYNTYFQPWFGISFVAVAFDALQSVSSKLIQLLLD